MASTGFSMGAGGLANYFQPVRQTSLGGLGGIDNFKPIRQTLFGKRDKPKQFQQFSPEQMQAMQQLFQGLGMGTGPYSDLFGEFDPARSADIFERGVAEPSMRNFRQRVIPSIMQSFADQGASSGLGNSLATPRS